MAKQCPIKLYETNWDNLTSREINNYRLIPTNATIFPREALRTSAGKIIHRIRTTAAILTRILDTVVDVWNTKSIGILHVAMKFRWHCWEIDRETTDAN